MKMKKSNKLQSNSHTNKVTNSTNSNNRVDDRNNQSLGFEAESREAESTNRNSNKITDCK